MDNVIQLLFTVVPAIHLYEWTSSRRLQEAHLTVPLSARTEIDRIVASITPLEYHGTTFSELLDNFPGILVLEIPRLKDGGLREVAVMSRTLDERGLDQIKAWSRFMRRLRTYFKSGALVSDPISGVTRYYRQAHAMKGALSMCRNGVQLLAAAGNAVYDFSKPE
jgi:hypothetical protein